MKDKKTTLIIGGIVTLITLLLFFIGINNKKDAIDYAALLFIIISECLFFGTMVFYNSQTAISSLAITSLTTVYLIISVLFSLLFKNFFTNNIPAFIILHLVLIGITAIAFIVLYIVLKDINKDEKKTITQLAVISECERVANILIQNDDFIENRDILDKIYDEIKYSDHVSNYKGCEILAVLSSIYECKDNEKINSLCQKALQLVKERNITVSQLKKENFKHV